MGESVTGPATSAAPARGGGVHFGITMIPADYAMSPVRLGAMVEAHGFESLWLGEHSHIPSSRLSAYPSGVSSPRSSPTSTTPSSAWPPSPR